MICEVPSLRERAALALVGLVGTLSSEVSEMETQPVLFFRRSKKRAKRAHDRDARGHLPTLVQTPRLFLSTAVVFM